MFTNVQRSHFATIDAKLLNKFKKQLTDVVSDLGGRNESIGSQGWHRAAHGRTDGAMRAGAVSGTYRARCSSEWW
jgi:hypothetical protein